MPQALDEVLEGREGSYVMPFLWLHEGGRDALPSRIAKLYESGCRSACIESRPHKDFCGDNWWADMEIVLEEANNLGMQVWILDDKHFPTGYANGIIKAKYQERRRWFLRERHVDVMGPGMDMSFLIPPCAAEEELLCVCAYLRGNEGEELIGEPCAIEVSTEEEFAYWDVPEGCWRIFFVYKTHYGNDPEHGWYIDMLSPEGSAALLEAVYEPHYQRFAKYFGNTLAGFFSDEPSLDCQHIGPSGQDAGFYYRTIGQPGMALPWYEDIINHMKQAVEINPLAAIPGLWYPIKEKSQQVRYVYMDGVTTLWRKNFSWRLGDWCRAHSVRYIGHIIEDQNAHARLGCSAGHYFRALEGQDMSGIDVVLHQVVPGMANYRIAASLYGGEADSPFFHYVLGQLASSQARMMPHMQGRAMCEVFGAYGWAEGTPLMKWMIDFLLVRGINHFVPHGFTDIYPDPDCPPHFYANGNNSQFEGFSALMRYTNKMAHLLSAADKLAAGLLLYTAEAEWMGGRAAELQEVARQLYDNQIDYDIVSIDMLAQVEVMDGQLIINDHSYHFLAIPGAPLLPEAFWHCFERITRQGGRILFVDRMPECVGRQPGRVVPLKCLAAQILREGLAHGYQVEDPLLRISHFRAHDAEYVMLFLETVTGSIQPRVHLPVRGAYRRVDLLNGITYPSEYTEDGWISLELSPYESALLCFDKTCAEATVPGNKATPIVQTPLNKRIVEFPLRWDIELLEQGIDETYRPFRQSSTLFNITGQEGEPGFSGRMRYRTRLDWQGMNASSLSIDLGRVGMTARLFLNGQDMGIRICPPYRWPIDRVICQGENAVEIIVANTLVQRLRDPLSQYLPIPPSGLLGPVTMIAISTS